MTTQIMPKEEQAKHKGKKYDDVSEYHNRLNELETNFHGMDADSIDKGLLEIIKAAVELGHADLLFHSYETINVIALKHRGVRERFMEYFRKASLDENYENMHRVMRHYGLKIQLPTKQELEDTLSNAIGLRGYSVDDHKTSVGRCFQLVYGRDYEGKNIPLTQRELDKLGVKPDKIPLRIGDEEAIHDWVGRVYYTFDEHGLKGEVMPIRPDERKDFIEGYKNHLIGGKLFLMHYDNGMPESARNMLNRRVCELKGYGLP